MYIYGRAFLRDDSPKNLHTRTDVNEITYHSRLHLKQGPLLPIKSKFEIAGIKNLHTPLTMGLVVHMSCQLFSKILLLDVQSNNAEILALNQLLAQKTNIFVLIDSK